MISRRRRDAYLHLTRASAKIRCTNGLRLRTENAPRDPRGLKDAKAFQNRRVPESKRRRRSREKKKKKSGSMLLYTSCEVDKKTARRPTAMTSTRDRCFRRDEHAGADRVRQKPVATLNPTERAAHLL